MRTAPPSQEKALITPASPAGEEGRVAAVLDAVEKHLGFVPDGLRLYSLSPPLLEAFVGNVSYFRGGTRLSPILTSMIRYLVSWQADCRFCVDLNGGFRSALRANLDAVRVARANPEAALIEESERPLLRLALKAVDEPHNVRQADLDAAQAQGWSDRDIFDAVVQAASNRAFNLVLRTFKVEHQGAFA